ncbi:MAG: nucleotide disphospho-sugar-binding domain-containing protein [archaeon]
MTRKKIVYMCMPGQGHLDWGGVTETLKRLQKKGHDVSVASGGYLKEFVLKQKISFINTELPSFKKSNNHQSIHDVFLDHIKNNFFDVNSHHNAFNIMKNKSIDILISDAHCHSAQLVSKKLNIPHIVIAPDPKIPNPKLETILQNHSKIFCDKLSNLTNINIRLIDQYPLLFDSEILNIHYSTPKFTMLKENNKTEFVGGDPIIKNSVKNKIYFSSGTLFWNEKLNESVKIINNIPNLKIYTTNSNGKISTPNGFIVKQYINELKNMGSFQFLIAQGGYGTISKGIRAGIPILVAPLFIANSLQAKRIDNYGNGLAIYSNEQTPENVYRCVNRLFKEQEFYEQAETLKKEYASLGGSEKATELILKY